MQAIIGSDLRHRANNVADDAPGLGGAGAVEEGIAETLGSFADRGVRSVGFIECGAGRDQAKVNRTFPVRIEAIEERLGIGAVIESAEVMREPAVLQSGLVATNKYPIIAGAE